MNSQKNLTSETGFQEDTNYYLLREVWEELKKDSRICEGTNSQGVECRGHALPYREKSQPVRCHAHSSKEAKDYNQKRKAEEERLFFQRLKEEEDQPF